MRIVLLSRPQHPAPQFGPCSCAPLPSTKAIARVSRLSRIMLEYSDCDGATCATFVQRAVRASLMLLMLLENSVRLMRPASMPFGFLVPPSTAPHFRLATRSHANRKTVLHLTRRRVEDLVAVELSLIHI